MSHIFHTNSFIRDKDQPVSGAVLGRMKIARNGSHIETVPAIYYPGLQSFHVRVDDGPYARVAA